LVDKSYRFKIFLGSDGHGGSPVGITHPAFQIKRGDIFDKIRKDQWDWLDEEITKIKMDSPFTHGLYNGDLIEGDGAETRGITNLYPDRIDQCRVAAALINFIDAPINYISKGTPRHTGRVEDWEEAILPLLRSSNNKIQVVFEFDCNGVKINMKHKPPSRSDAALRKAFLANVLLNIRFKDRGACIANIILRSHVHKAIAVCLPGYRFLGIITPALQGIGDGFGARQLDNEPPDFGFVVLYINDINDFTYEFHIAPMDIQRRDIICL